MTSANDLSCDQMRLFVSAIRSAPVGVIAAEAIYRATEPIVARDEVLRRLSEASWVEARLELAEKKNQDLYQQNARLRAKLVERDKQFIQQEADYMRCVHRLIQEKDRWRRLFINARRVIARTSQGMFSPWST